MKKIFLNLSLVCFISYFFLQGCKKPDQEGPADKYCTAGQSVLTIDDSKVPSTLKSKIYSPGGVFHTAHPNFNKNGNVVVIPYATPDFPANTALTTQVIRDEFFATGVGSASDFFYENSWGQFKLVEKQISKVSILPKAFFDYKYTESDPYLMTDVCQNSSINWADVDLNKDHSITSNEVQIVFVQATGGLGVTRYPKNAFNANDPDYKNLPNYITVTDNTGGIYYIYNYFVTIGCKADNDPTKSVNTLSYNSSTLWHELCHGMFNLPDRYTSYCGTGPTGQFDLMSDNCARLHMNIYDKMRIGWVKPKISYANFSSGEPQGTNIEGGNCLSMAAIENQPAALIRWLGTSPDEFWIIENRNKSSSARNFEDGLPDEGLAIWWVDMTDGSVRLVDASNAGLSPVNFKDQGPNALFKYAQSNSIYQALLKNKQAGAAFGIKSISPAGSVMYFSF